MVAVIVLVALVGCTGCTVALVLLGAVVVGVASSKHLFIWLSSSQVHKEHSVLLCIMYVVYAWTQDIG